MRNDSMPLFDHFGELRKHVIWIGITLVATMIAGFFVAQPIVAYFKQAEPASGMDWNAFAPWDGIRVYMQFSFMLSLVVTSPFTLYRIWSFVKPGLTETERKATLRYIPYTVILFLAGLGFAYFVVFPLTFQFTTNFNDSMALVETYGIAQYFSFMFNILLPISLLFEMPIVVMFLTRLGILNPVRLRKIRRYAYMSMIVLATFITPPDIISVLVVAVPLILLYEVSIFISTYFQYNRAVKSYGA